MSSHRYNDIEHYTVRECIDGRVWAGILPQIRLDLSFLGHGIDLIPMKRK